MSAGEEDETRQLLKQVLAPMDHAAKPGRDLWPQVLRRIEGDEPAARSNWVWFDCALAAGLALMAAAFPASIPLLLYCF